MLFLKLLLFRIYTSLSTIFEYFFLLKKKRNSHFTDIGYEKLKLKNSKLKHDIFEKVIEDNKYFQRKIIKKNLIDYFLSYFFLENDNLNYITNITGYNYSIDFILAYSTLNIEKENQKKAIYANHWHRDKPFSKNTIKIILPIDTINEHSGPMEIISIEQSKTYNDQNIGSFDIDGSYKLIGTPEYFFIFKPNICYHRAGNPAPGLIRSQIMMQLNPSKKWEYSQKLYEKQFKLEPKFPLINFFEKKFKLKLL
jgi:hypothetical protein